VGSIARRSTPGSHQVSTSIRQWGSVSDRFGSLTVISPAARNALCRLKAGRKVVEAQAHRVRLGTFEAVLAVKGEQPQPRVEIGGEVRGEHPACVDLSRLRGQVRQPHVLVGADVVFDLGVVAVQCVEELDLVGAGDAPHVSDVRRGDRIPPAGLLLEGGQLLHVPPGGAHAADDQPHALRPAVTGVQVGQLRDLVAPGGRRLASARSPRHFGELPDRRLVLGRDLSAGRVTDRAPLRVQRQKVFQQTVGGARAVNADQDLRLGRVRV
jgi:hypothetical protein